MTKTAAVLAIAAAATCLHASDAHWNGGRTIPVHRLAPRDADGDAVDPAARHPRAISTQQTCSQCHDVDAMRGASHFRTGLEPCEAEPSVAVEPWFLADDRTGTAVPLSLHGQKGAYAPSFLGITCWEWTKMFGRSFPGGGVGSHPAAMASADRSRQRWSVTGPLEPNCLACHQQGDYDSSEWARQVLRENWRGAATAASGIGAVEGMNERLDAAWDVEISPDNPDDHLFRVPENPVYDMKRFDAKGRCVFNVGKPRNENCLACHSVSQKGMPSHAIAGDVHLKRGMKCIDCHQNGIDHRVKTRSCASCHVDAKGAGPKPVHAGIPLVHFEKLACTVCHSGVTEGGDRALVRTSRANRIGIYGRAQWATDAPYIVEPVFVRGEKGVVEPHRMMWPSGFFRASADGSLRPVPPEEAAALAGDALTVVERVEAALALLRETEADVKLGKLALRADGSLCYASEMNEVPLIAAEDRVKDEFKFLLVTLYNAMLTNKVAACRGGKVSTIDWQGTVSECADVKAPADGEWPVGTLSADGKKFVPLVDRWSVEQYFKVRDSDQPLTKEMVARALANAGDGMRYLSAGVVFSLDKDGKLVETEGAAEARPVSWPVGHDVRPACQARGAEPAKCADCHTGDSEFFRGEVTPVGPVQDAAAKPLRQSELLGVGDFYHSVLGSTFSLRPTLKVTLWTIFGLMCLFAAAAAGAALNRLGGWLSGHTRSFSWGLFKWLLDVGLVLSLLYLAASGAVGWLCGGMAGWWLVLHMVAGGCFSVCTVLIMTLRAAERTKWRWCAVAWMFWVVFASGTVFTAVMPMMTVFGSHGQHILLWSHRCVAMSFAAVSCLVCLILLRRRRRKNRKQR